MKTKNNVRVFLEYIGEGYNGDYNPDDNYDKPLLRFYVEEKINKKWYEVDSASHCTCIPLSTNKKRINDIESLILERVYESVINGSSIKKICEELSWLNH